MSFGELISYESRCERFTTGLQKIKNKIKSSPSAKYFLSFKSKNKNKSIFSLGEHSPAGRTSGAESKAAHATASRQSGALRYDRLYASFTRCTHLPYRYVAFASVSVSLPNSLPVVSDDVRKVVLNFSFEKIGRTNKSPLLPVHFFCRGGATL